MIVTIELSEKEVEVLGKWASVGRTLDNSRVLAEQVFYGETVEVSRAQIARDELQLLRQPLDSLHYKIRTQIWHEHQPSEPVGDLPESLERKLDSKYVAIVNGTYIWFLGTEDTKRLEKWYTERYQQPVTILLATL